MDLGKNLFVVVVVGIERKLNYLGPSHIDSDHVLLLI